MSGIIVPLKSLRSDGKQQIMRTSTDMEKYGTIDYISITIIKIQSSGFEPFVLFCKKKSPDILAGKLFWILTLIFQEIKDIVFIAGNGTLFEIADFSSFLKQF